MTAITKCAGLILIKCSTPSFALLSHWIGVHCTMKLCDFQVTWIRMHTGYKLCTVCLLKSWIRLRLRGISWVSTGLPPWRWLAGQHSVGDWGVQHRLGRMIEGDNRLITTPSVSPLKIAGWHGVGDWGVKHWLEMMDKGDNRLRDTSTLYRTTNLIYKSDLNSNSRPDHKSTFLVQLDYY